MGSTGFDYLAQAGARNAEEQAAQSIADKQKQKAAKAALYWNAVQTPLPKPDDPAYQDALKKREDLLKGYIGELGPEQHATIGDRLHGLIFGPEHQEMQANAPVSSQAPVPPGAPPAQTSPAGTAQPDLSHPFQHNPVYAGILKGLEGLGSHLKSAANPVPKEKIDYESLASVPTPEERAASEKQTLQEEAEAARLEQIREQNKGKLDVAGLKPQTSRVYTLSHLTGDDLAKRMELFPDEKILGANGQEIPLDVLAKAPQGTIWTQFRQGGQDFWAPTDPTTKTVTIGNEVYQVGQYGSILSGGVPLGQQKVGTTHTQTQTAPGGAQVVSGTSTITPGTSGINSPSAPQANPPSAQKKSSGALNPYANPEDQPPQEALRFNQQWAKQGPYLTQLSPQDEQVFQQWVKTNKVPWQDSPTSDYDMRGYWKALQQGKAKQSFNAWDHSMHFPDTWKTPYSGTFSRESMYALPSAPRWVGDKLTTQDGKVVTDETPKAKSSPSNPKGPVSSQAPQLGGESILPNVQNMTPRNAALAMKTQPAVSALLGLYGDPNQPDVRSMADYAPLAADPHAQKVLGEAFKLLDQNMGEISDPGIIATLGTAAGWANFRANAEAQAQQNAGSQMTPEEKNYFDTAIASMADIIGARSATGQSPARFSVRAIQNELPLIGTSSVTNPQQYLNKMLTVARQVQVGLNGMPDNSRALKYLQKRENDLIKQSNALSPKLNKGKPVSSQAPKIGAGTHSYAIDTNGKRRKVLDPNAQLPTGWKWADDGK